MEAVGLCAMVGREVETRGSRRKLSAPRRARNLSGDFSSCTLWQNSPGHTIQRIVDLKGEIAVGKQMCWWWRLANENQYSRKPTSTLICTLTGLPSFIAG